MDQNKFSVEYQYGPLPVAPPVPTRPGAAAPAAQQWPPGWLELPCSPTVPPRPTVPPAMRGWRLPNGTVVCAGCQPQPPGSTPVTLRDCGGGPVWVDTDGSKLGTVQGSANTPPAAASATTEQGHQRALNSGWL